MTNFLENVTAIVQELPALFNAIADTIPAIVRMLVMLGVGIFILGIFSVIITGIASAMRSMTFRM